jgi:hypothetical protein
MAEPAIRFPGARERFPNLPAFVRGHLGYQLIGFEDDYVIAEDDPQLRSGPRRPLSAHSSVSLSGKNRHKVSGKLISYIPGQMDEYYQSNAQRIEWNLPEDSQLTRAYQLQTEMVVAPNEDVRGILRDRVLPFMLDEIRAVSVCPVTVDASLQQAHITLAKFGLLVDKYEDSVVEDLVFQKQVYKAILPTSLDIINYVTSMTRLMPFALTLPVQRSDCVWNFIPNGTLFFAHLRCTSLFSLFSDKINPLSQGTSLITLKKWPR